LFLSDYNAPSGNILGIAIGATALILYYQFIAEYYSKMLQKQSLYISLSGFYLTTTGSAFQLF
ncbi:MAG: hypothetical protein QW139_01585, partial [Candidatus Micrarchaeaceae archaeon]